MSTKLWESLELSNNELEQLAQYEEEQAKFWSDYAAWEDKMFSESFKEEIPQ